MSDKNHAEYQQKSDDSFKETLKSLGISDPKARRYLEKYKAGIDISSHKLIDGDPQSINESEQINQMINNDLYGPRGILTSLRASNDYRDKATANTIEQGIGQWGSEMRGPNLIERMTIEPYYNRKEGFKAAGIAALIGGGVLGLALSRMFGAASWLQAAAMTLFVGLSAGIVVPGAMSWLGNKMGGKNTSDSEHENQGGKSLENGRGKTQQQSKYVSYKYAEDRSPSDHINNNRDIQDLSDDVRNHAWQAAQNIRGNQQNFQVDFSQQRQYMPRTFVDGVPRNPNIPYPTGAYGIYYGNQAGPTGGIGPQFIPYGATPANNILAYNYSKLPFIANDGYATVAPGAAGTNMGNYGGLNGNAHLSYPYYYQTGNSSTSYYPRQHDGFKGIGGGQGGWGQMGDGTPGGVNQGVAQGRSGWIAGTVGGGRNLVDVGPAIDPWSSPVQAPHRTRSRVKQQTQQW